MYIPGFILVSLLIIFLIRRKIARANKDYGKDFEVYLREEQEANFSRRKEIPEEMFYTPDLSTLPINDESFNPVLQKYKKLIIEQGAKKMLCSSRSLSNRDLKMSFGLPNLEFVAEYEENFAEYINCLNEYATALVDEGMLVQAEIILNECIKAGSDISKTYILLTDIYAVKNDMQKLYGLIEKVNNADLPDSIKSKTLVYINDIMYKNKDAELKSNGEIFNNEKA